MKAASKIVAFAAGLGTAAVASAGSVTVTNTDVANIPLAPDNGCLDDTAGTGGGGITRTIAFTETGTITDIDLGVEFTQTWRGDVQVGLSYSGGGSTVQVISGVGGSADNMNFLGDSEAGFLCSDATSGCGNAALCVTPPGPTCQPTQALTVFNGLATPGTFTMTACDRAGGDAGDLVSWSVTAAIDVDNGAPLAPTVDLPIFGGGIQQWLVLGLMSLGLVGLGRRFLRSQK